jgi:acetate kinase
MRILVFNSGSSSLKFALVEVPERGPLSRVYDGAFEDAADGSGRLQLRSAAAMGAPRSPIRTPAEAAEFVIDALRSAQLPLANALADIAASAHRVVHGGDLFRVPTQLGDVELAALARLSELAPLHNPPAVSVITAVRLRLGPQVPAVGVFDTAYYADLPAAAARYAIPLQWVSQYGVHRYGFHGIAHQYLCQAARARLASGVEAERIISLQLGRGCSVTATRGGRAIATSMGFTPLEGLVMGTRSGDVDPGALLYVMERSGLSAAQMRHALNYESGLLGLSGRSADMRTLLEAEARTVADAALAIEVFCRRARHYVAAYLSDLGGADLIVFGGGIGENSPAIRQRILSGLEWAGVQLDAEANTRTLGMAADIGARASRTAIQVIPVDEVSVIAQEAAALLRGGH